MVTGVITIVNVPDGVTSGGGASVGLVLTVLAALPQPPAKIAEKKRTVVTVLVHARCLSLNAPANIRRCLLATTKAKTKASSKSTGTPTGGTKRHGIEGGRIAGPLVETETVNGEGAPLVIETLAGTWHVAFSGAPLQVSAMVPAKLVPGVNCN
jgi:hypothetical protein